MSCFLLVFLVFIFKVGLLLVAVVAIVISLLILCCLSRSCYYFCLRFVNQVKTAPSAASVVATVAIAAAAAICSPGVISAHGIGRTSRSASSPLALALDRPLNSCTSSSCCFMYWKNEKEIIKVGRALKVFFSGLR